MELISIAWLTTPLQGLILQFKSGLCGAGAAPTERPLPPAAQPAGFHPSP